jgi:hypothetical protein
MNSFPTFPSDPYPKLIDIHFTKEKNKSFIREITLDFNNIFGSSGTFTLERVYDTVSILGDAVGNHFRGLESYPNPLYVGPPDSEFYFRTCWLTYDATNDEFFGRYDDNGPDGIFFWFKASADFIRLWASDFDTLVWEPRDENGFGGGTLTINGASIYRPVDASIYNRTLAFEAVLAGPFAPINNPVLSRNILPSDEENKLKDSQCFIKKREYEVIQDGGSWEIYLGFGHTFDTFVPEDEYDYPPQWFIYLKDSDGIGSYFYRGGSIFGNDDPDNIKIDGLWSEYDNQGGFSWLVTEYV